MKKGKVMKKMLLLVFLLYVTNLCASFSRISREICSVRELVPCPSHMIIKENGGMQLIGTFEDSRCGFAYAFAKNNYTSVSKEGIMYIPSNVVDTNQIRMLPLKNNCFLTSDVLELEQELKIVVTMCDSSGAVVSHREDDELARVDRIVSHRPIRADHMLLAAKEGMSVVVVECFDNANDLPLLTKIIRVDEKGLIRSSVQNDKKSFVSQVVALDERDRVVRAGIKHYEQMLSLCVSYCDGTDKEFHCADIPLIGKIGTEWQRISSPVHEDETTEATSSFVVLETFGIREGQDKKESKEIGDFILVDNDEEYGLDASLLQSVGHDEKKDKAYIVDRSMQFDDAGIMTFAVSGLGDICSGFPMALVGQITPDAKFKKTFGNQGRVLFGKSSSSPGIYLLETIDALVCSKDKKLWLTGHSKGNLVIVGLMENGKPNKMIDGVGFFIPRIAGKPLQSDKTCIVIDESKKMVIVSSYEHKKDNLYQMTLTQLKETARL